MVTVTLTLVVTRTVKIKICNSPRLLSSHDNTISLFPSHYHLRIFLTIVNDYKSLSNQIKFWQLLLATLLNLCQIADRFSTLKDAFIGAKRIATAVHFYRIALGELQRDAFALFNDLHLARFWLKRSHFLDHSQSCVLETHIAWESGQGGSSQTGLAW